MSTPHLRLVPAPSVTPSPGAGTVDHTPSGDGSSPDGMWVTAEHCAEVAGLLQARMLERQRARGDRFPDWLWTLVEEMGQLGRAVQSKGAELRTAANVDEVRGRE